MAKATRRVDSEYLTRILNTDECRAEELERLFAKAKDKGLFLSEVFCAVINCYFGWSFDRLVGDVDPGRKLRDVYFNYFGINGDTWYGCVPGAASVVGWNALVELLGSKIPLVDSIPRSSRVADMLLGSDGANDFRSDPQYHPRRPTTFERAGEGIGRLRVMASPFHPNPGKKSCLVLYRGDADCNYGKIFPYFAPEIVAFMTKYGSAVKQANSSHNYFSLCVSDCLGMINLPRMHLSLDYEMPFRPQFDPGVDSEGVKDALGCCYYTPTRRGYDTGVVLYMKAILDCADALRLDPYDLMLVVYTHELVHYAFFNASPLGGDKFFPFEVINSHYLLYEVKFQPQWSGTSLFHETLAQLVTQRVVGNDGRLKECFTKLNEHQPAVYSNWKRFERTTKCHLQELVHRVCDDPAGIDRPFAVN